MGQRQRRERYIEIMRQIQRSGREKEERETSTEEINNDRVVEKRD